MTWTGQRRPRAGQPARRLSHPETRQWLVWPGNDEMMRRGDGGWSQYDLDRYEKAWRIHDHQQALRDREERELKAEREEALAARKRGLASGRLSKSLFRNRVMAQLEEVPPWWAEWWEKLETWIETHPPKTYRGAIGDLERELDLLDWEPDVPPDRSRRGWAKGRHLSLETRMKMSETRRKREAEGTWGHRTPALRRPLPGPDWEQDEIERLRKEARGDDRE